MKQSDVAVLIPSFEPDSVQLTKLSKDLFARGFFVLIVNDGSSAAFDNAFNSAAKFATVIGYPTNGGKGFALKYGFNYIKEKLPEISYIITADGDGQHAIEDIVRVSELLKKENRSTSALASGGRAGAFFIDRRESKQAAAVINP